MDWLPNVRRHPYNTDGGSWTERTDPKGCLHTTEGASWPSYDDGAKAPHATVLPSPGKGVTVRQHTPFSRAARALRNPDGGVQTNRDYVFQFELIGTCDKNGPGYYWPDADDAVLADLYRQVVKPLSDAFNIPLRSPEWLAYPVSYGSSSVRMSGSTFDNYSGWLGHQHVPENVHGDPGLFPWARMLEVGDDMPLNADDKAWIAATIRAEVSRAFDVDTVPAPDRSDTKTNPNWAPSTYLHNIGEWALTNRDNTTAILAAIKALNAQVAAVNKAVANSTAAAGIYSGQAAVTVNLQKKA